MRHRRRLAGGLAERFEMFGGEAARWTVADDPPLRAVQQAPPGGRQAPAGCQDGHYSPSRRAIARKAATVSTS